MHQSGIKSEPITGVNHVKKIAIEQHYVSYEHRHLAGSAHVPPAVWMNFESRLLDFENHRLSEMNELGINMEILSFGSPGVQGLTDVGEAVELSTRLNDDLAKVIAHHPTRFAGFAALPTQSPEAAAAELERSVTELRFKGALINGTTNGVFLDDPRFLPLFAKAEALGCPLYLHPAPGHEKLSIYAGHPYLEGPMWSWGVETATHVLRLIFAGIFDRFPRLTIVLGHMGEGLPYTLARLDSRYRIAKLDKPLRRLPSEYISENIAVTTSGVASTAPLLCAMAAVGADRILFATDYPFESNHEAVKFMEQAPVSEADRAKIFYGNSEKLFGIKLASSINS